MRPWKESTSRGALGPTSERQRSNRVRRVGEKELYRTSFKMVQAVELRGADLIECDVACNVMCAVQKWPAAVEKHGGFKSERAEKCLSEICFCTSVCLFLDCQL